MVPDPTPHDAPVLGAPGPPILIEDRTALADIIVSLLVQVQREVLGLVDPGVAAACDREPAVRALEGWIARRPRRPLRLVVTDATEGFRALPRLVELARRFPSFIHLRGLADEEAVPMTRYLVLDRAGVIEQPDPGAPRFHVHAGQPALARRRLAEFERWWEHGAPLAGVHTLGLGR